MNSCPGTCRFALSLAFAATGISLSACSPAWDWREIRSEDAGFQVLLPAKPVSMSRPIELDGLKVTMTMTGARVGETTFTVGAVELPDASPATREKATAAMRAGMVRNLRGHETAAVTVEVPVVDAAGRRIASEPASRVEVDGTASEKPVHMSATFVSRGDHAWQAVMMGPSHDAENAKLFHDSLRISE